MKKVLVTGGSGFIGRNILESFIADKYELLAPSHAELDLLDAERLDFWMHHNRPDLIIHTAVKPGHRNAHDTTNLLYSNTRMYFNLARHASNVEKMLVLGSGAIYDVTQCHPWMREEEWRDRIPADEHGFCKYICAESIEHSSNIVDLRIFGIFGKHEDYAIRFISNMICKTIFDLPLTIKQDRVMSYLYVDDLIPIIDRFLSDPLEYHSYNITPSTGYRLMDLAQLVLELAGKALPIEVSTPGMGIEYTGANSRLKTRYPETDFTPIREAVAALITWYHEVRDTIDCSKLVFDK